MEYGSEILVPFIMAICYLAWFMSHLAKRDAEKRQERIKKRYAPQNHVIMWLLCCKYGNNKNLNKLPKTIIRHIGEQYLKPREIYWHYICNHRLRRVVRYGIWIHDKRFYSGNCKFEQYLKPCLLCHRPDHVAYGHRNCMCTWCPTCGYPKQLKFYVERSGSYLTCEECGYEKVYIRRINGQIEF